MDSKQTNHLETSILETREVLLQSLEGCSTSMDIHSFITHRALARPPFSFIQNLVKIYVTSLSFALGLFTDEELDSKSNNIRQDKVYDSFLLSLEFKKKLIAPILLSYLYFSYLPSTINQK